MSEVQNNLGEKFKETIAEAMKTGDFHALNTLVTDTVNDALREADFQANLSREATEKKVWNSQRSWQDKKREEVKTEAEIQAERQQREKPQRAGKTVGRTAEGAGSREPCTESGTAGDTQKSYCGRNDVSGQNGEEGKCVRNTVHRVRRDRSGIQRPGTAGTVVTGSFSGSISECGNPSGGIVSCIFRDDLLWQRTA